MKKIMQDGSVFRYTELNNGLYFTSDKTQIKQNIKSLKIQNKDNCILKLGSDVCFGVGDENGKMCLMFLINSKTNLNLLKLCLFNIYDINDAEEIFKTIIFMIKPNVTLGDLLEFAENENNKDSVIDFNLN